MCDLETIESDKTAEEGRLDLARMAGVEKALDDVKSLFSGHFNEAEAAESILVACAELRSDDAHTENS